MQVVRVFCDTPVGIKLTDDELFSAYKEQQHIFDVMYVQENLREMLAVLKLEPYWATLNSDCWIEQMAEEFRRNQDKYGLDADENLQKVIMHTVTHLKELGNRV